MRRLASILSMIALGGCATHHAPAATVPATQPSSDWAAVRALPKGTSIVLALDDNSVRRTVVSYATETELTILDFDRPSTTDRSATIARDRVARVSVTDQIGSKKAPWYIGIPIASAILGGLAGVVGGAVAKNKEVVQTAAWTFGIGLMTGVAAGPMDYPRPTYVVRPVYVRR